jgi:hypothetical protein
MNLRELPYFRKGAQLALDNTLDDYLGNPEMSLLEVIADLEDKRPIVGVVKEDWQRRCMAEGARWVGEAIVGWWEEWFGEEEGSDDNNWEDEDGNENIEEVALRAVNNVGERDEIRQRGDSMMVDDEVEQPGAEREKTGHGLGSAGLGDREISQEEVGEAAVEDGEPGDLAVKGIYWNTSPHLQIKSTTAMTWSAMELVLPRSEMEVKATERRDVRTRKKRESSSAF